MKRYRLTFLSLVVALGGFLLFAFPLQAQTTLTETVETDVQLEVPPTTITVYGCTAPFGLVTVFLDNLTTGTVVAGGDGQFSKTMTVNSFGIHNIKAYSEDVNGLRTSTISTNISVAPQLDTLREITLPPAISLNAAVFAAGQQMIFVGSTCPNTDVDLILDNNIELDLQTDVRGEYYATLSSAGLYLGEHSFQARRFASLGGSAVSQKQLFRVVESLRDNETGDELTAEDLLPPRIVTPEDNHIASTPVVTFTGTAQPNVQLEIIVDGNIVGSVFSNPIGEWSFEFSMTEIQHSVVARACLGDYCTQPSNEVTIFYHSALGQCNFNFEFEKYRFFKRTIKGGIDLNLLNIEATPPFDLIIDWGDDAVENTTLAANRPTNYHHVYHFVGLYNGIVTVTDSFGCTQTQYFSVEVVYDSGSLWWIIPFIIAAAAVAYITRNTYEEHRLRDLLLKKQDLEAREAALELEKKRHAKEVAARKAATRAKPAKKTAKRKATAKKATTKKK